MLRCPTDRTPLAIADEELVNQLNAGIGRGEVRDRADQKVHEIIESGLITESGDWVYPIRGGIVTLVADQAISTHQ